MVAYLDAARDREDAESRRRIQEGRAAAVFADGGNSRAYQRWLRSAATGDTAPRGLSGAALESAIGQLALQHGANVMRDTIPAAELARRRAEIATTPTVRWEGR